MTATARPRVTVAAPTLSPLPFGLLSVAAEAPRDEHALFGVQYEPVSGVIGGVVGLDLNLAPTGTLTPEHVEVDGTLPTIFTEPFLIHAVVTGHFAPNSLSIGELQDRAGTKLALSASRWIERGLYTGASGGAALAAAGTATLAASPVAPWVGIGLLEGWIADTVGAQGVIHAPRLAVASLTHNQLTDTAGPRLLTRDLDTPIAAGAGYLNTAPGGAAAAAGVAWLYATGPVLVNRSETLLRVTPDGAKADLVHGSATAYATEVVSVGFEAGVVAVPITL